MPVHLSLSSALRTTFVNDASDPWQPTGVSAGEALACFLITGSITLLFAWRQQLPDVAGRGTMDPDSTMRLVRLAAPLHVGTPVDVIFRDGSGEGFALYWPHLLALP